MPCRSCGPAVGDGTTRGGLVGHFCDACTYVRLQSVASSVPLSLPPRRGSRSPYIVRFVRYYKRNCLLHVRYRDGARLKYILAYLCSMLSEPSGNTTGPSRSHRVRSLIGPDRLRTLAYGSAYAPMTRTVRMHSQPLQFPRPPSTRYSRPAVAGVAVALPELQQKPQQ